jgi:tetratricopeptide (TPR) repeat protein
LVAALLVLLAMLPMAARSMEDAGDLATLRSRVSDLTGVGRFAEAVVLAERSRELAERRLGPRDPELAQTLRDLAYLYLKLERHGDAEILSARALAIYDGSSARPGGKLWSIMRRLAEAYTKQGRAADAQAALARARAIEQAVSAPFEIELAVPTEIITTDLKRLRTHDCGVVSFKVDDAPALLFSFESFALVQLRVRLDINSAMRRIVGSRSSAQVLGEADQIGRELAASLDDLAVGYAVRATPEDIASCLR